jgi:hypothetical protein
MENRESLPVNIHIGARRGFDLYGLFFISDMDYPQRFDVIQNTRTKMEMVGNIIDQILYETGNNTTL